MATALIDGYSLLFALNTQLRVHDAELVIRVHLILAKPVDTDTIVKALLDGSGPDDAATPDQTLSVPRLEWGHIQRALKMHRRTLQRKLSKRPSRD